VSFPSRHCPRSHLQNSHPLFINIRSTAYPCRFIIYLFCLEGVLNVCAALETGLEESCMRCTYGQTVSGESGLVYNHIWAGEQTDRQKQTQAWSVGNGMRCMHGQETDRGIDYWGKNYQIAFIGGGGVQRKGRLFGSKTVEILAEYLNHLFVS
jgi:hypothetical protein